MSGKPISRRSFLASAGLAGVFSSLYFDPVRHLLQSIVRGQILESRTKTLSNRLTAHPTRNLVQLHLYGAPSRWFFDHVLRPSDNDPYLPYPGIYNRILEINARAPHLSKGIYSDVKMKGINMPHLWQYDVARADGGARPMSDLMSHMLMIRGGDMGTEGHPINSARLVAPVVGDVSITGLVADATGALIPAISVGCTPANRAYKSRLGVCSIDVPSDHPDYVSFLLEAFQRADMPNYRDQAAIDVEVENALGALRAYSLSNNPGAAVLYNERRRAESLVRKGIRNLGDVFTPLVRKYDSLFQGTMRLSPISGVTDMELPGLKFPCEVSGNRDAFDALASHHLNEYFLCLPDLRKMFSNAKTQNLAKHFALAEFALTEGLSSSILLAPPQERGQTFIDVIPGESYGLGQIEKSFDPTRNVSTFNLKAGAQRVPAENQLPHDSHATGWLTNVVACNLFYRGLSACLLELIDRLEERKVGSGTLFDETVIHLATEFDRAPKQSGATTNHNPSAHVTSLFSGIIRGPAVIGNVYVGRSNEKRGYPPGTMGNAAPIAALHNKTITSANISSTLSEMLRVPRIVSRAEPLVTIKDGRVIPSIETARNVEDEA